MREKKEKSYRAFLSKTEKRKKRLSFCDFNLQEKKNSAIFLKRIKSAMPEVFIKN